VQRPVRKKARFPGLFLQLNVPNQNFRCTPIDKRIGGINVTGLHGVLAKPG
jgi:hypothetical protein